MVDGAPKEYRDRRNWAQIRNWAKQISADLATAHV